MKNPFFYTLVILVAFCFSCEKDNYDEPSSMLQGNIVYNGEAIPVSYNDVGFELYEPGWQLKHPINVLVDQDGSYSTVLFDADYQLVFRPNQGPFVTNFDTLDVAVRGNTNFDIEVLPYYMIENPQFSVTADVLSATFSINKIVTDERSKDIERISLYLGKTLFVDGRTSLATADLFGEGISIENQLSLSVNIPDIQPVQDYIFARIGVKMAGVEDMIFTQVERLELQ